MKHQIGTNEESCVVTTVTGDVPADSLGLTLPHEHVIHRLSIHSGKADNICVDRDLVVEELNRFRDAGGGAVCDVTPIDADRNPLGLREVSERSGIKIISGIGLYQVETWPEHLRTCSRRQLADFLIHEARGGDSGIPAGLLGEIGSHNEDHADWKRYRLWEKEVTLFQAIADVQRDTGLCVYTHASAGRAGVAQLRTIIEAGGDPRRVVIGHCDARVHADIAEDMDYYHTLLEGGAWLGFDLFGWDTLASDEARITRIVQLVNDGFSGRILLSTDTCRRSQLHRFGGRGFDFLITSALPKLLEAGVSRQEIHRMTACNPARILSRQAKV